jgi:cysteine desulfurase
MLPQIKPSKKLIYLDHAATTPLDPSVEKAMAPFWRTSYGNPSSLYKEGREGLAAVSEARQTVAKILGAQPKEIIFTAGGTESVNLAIFGVARAYELAHKKKGHIIASAIEHHAVLHSLDALEEEGWDISLINVDKDGVVKLDDLKKAIRKNTVLVSIMYANNEIGTIEPIAEIGKWVSGLNKIRAGKNLPKIYFHTDACQAGNSLELEAGKLGVDLLSINGSKICGPKQTGALYVKNGTPLRPIIFGGGQERNLRSGIENVPGVVGLAAALQLAQKNLVKEPARVKILRDSLLTQILKKIPGVTINGPDPRNAKDLRRLPNNVNISIKDIEGEAAMFYLDSYNIAVSTGSACSSSSPDPSHVILALGKTQKDAFSSIRLTLGKDTTRAEIEYFMKVFPDIVKNLRSVNK